MDRKLLITDFSNTKIYNSNTKDNKNCILDKNADLYSFSKKMSNQPDVILGYFYQKNMKYFEKYFLHFP